MRTATYTERSDISKPKDRRVKGCSRIGVLEFWSIGVEPGRNGSRPTTRLLRQVQHRSGQAISLQPGTGKPGKSDGESDSCRSR